MAIHIRRRELISLIGGAAWPLAARAQQPAPPLIGFLTSLASSDLNLVVPAFREGLNGAGFVEGRNIAVEYRWAEGDYQRLPTLAADLVRRKVAVIAAISGTPAALAAKAATATIPIVFAMASDPVDAGLVGSLNRPGDNITGATFFTALLGEKRMELLREFVPKATTIAVLVNPDNRAGVVDGTNAQAAAHAMGLRAIIFDARASREIDAAFATLAHEQPARLEFAQQPAGVPGVQVQSFPQVRDPGRRALGDFEDDARFTQGVLGVGRAFVQHTDDAGVEAIECADGRNPLGQL